MREKKKGLRSDLHGRAGGEGETRSGHWAGIRQRRGVKAKDSNVMGARGRKEIKEGGSKSLKTEKWQLD